MSFLLDPIESGIDEILDPLSSVFALPSTSTAEPVQPAETMGNSQSTTISEATPTATAISVITPSTTVETSTTAFLQSSSTSKAEVTTSRSTSLSSSRSTISASSTSEASRSSSSSSSSSTLARTTLSTSITSTASASTSSSLTSTSAVPAAPSVTPPLSPAQSNSGDTVSSPSSGSKISTAGIVVAIIFAVALLVSIIWLIFRFCPPVRRRIDAWSSARRRDRTYREAIDGPVPPEKDDAYSLSSQGSQQRKSVSAQAAEKIGVGKRPLSFFGIGGNPSIEPKSSYSWKVESASGPVHQQYVSPNSAETPRGDGLGLGRVSLLRNHSLLRRAGYNVPPMPGPSMTQTQAEIAGMGRTPKQTISAVPPQQEVKRKPLPAPLPIPAIAASMSPRARPFSYEVHDVNVARPKRSAESVQSAKPTDKNSPLPRLQLEIPPTPIERRSQIGLAVTSCTPPIHGQGRNVVPP